MTLGTIGDVLNSSLSSIREPVTIFVISSIGEIWRDDAAEAALKSNGDGLPINGDCITVPLNSGVMETRWFQDGKWLAIDDYIQPESELCACCGGLGAKQVPFLKGLITCPDCSGTGKGKDIVKPKTEKSRPGLGDEIRPDLMNKKLRDWS